MKILILAIAANLAIFAVLIAFYHFFPPEHYHTRTNMMTAWLVVLLVLALFVAEVCWGGGDPNRR